MSVVGDDAPIERNELMDRLQRRGVSTRPGTHAVTELGYYRKHLDLEPGQFPEAARLETHTLALPLHNRMDADDYQFVVDALHDL